MSDDSADLREAKRWSIWTARAISYLVYGYVLVVEVILLLGFILLLFGANPTAAFTEWAYRSLERAMAPFRGIFTPIELGTTGNSEVASVFDTSVVFAMIVYGILAIALGSLVRWLTYRMRLVDQQIEEADREAEIRAREEAYDAKRADAEARLALEQEAKAAAQSPPADDAGGGQR